MKNFLIAVLTVFLSAGAFAGKDKQPQITEVFATDGQLFIIGNNFDSPEVSLGNFAPLLLDGLPGSDLLVVFLPDSIEPGDYKLTVSQGKGGKYADDYDLTIGAVGTNGEQGPQGERGPMGQAGPRGEQGEKGETGPKGDPGKDGIDGQDGVDGLPGNDLAPELCELYSLTNHDVPTLCATFCGDGISQVWEECDNGEDNGVESTSDAWCDESCSLHNQAFCGDGTVDPDEECDDGEWNVALGSLEPGMGQQSCAEGYPCNHCYVDCTLTNFNEH